MFGGTGSFRGYLCPQLKSPNNKNQAGSSGLATCGRPHCKYSHSAELLSQQQNGITASSNPYSTKRSSFSAGSRLSPPVETPSPSSSTSIPPVWPTEESVRGADDAVSVVAPLHNGAAAVSLPLDSSKVTLQKSEIDGLIVRPNSDHIPRPTYSDAPDQSTSERNPYSFDWVDSTQNTQPNDLEYDPINNWRMPFRSTITEPEAVETATSPAPSETVPPAVAAAAPPANLTAAAAIRHRIAETDSVVALGKKPVGRPPAAAVPGKIAPASSWVPAPRKRVEKSPAEPPRLVKKKARFGKAVDDDDVMEIPVQPSGKTAGTSEAEVMKSLFGADDEEDDEIMVELPIEMPAKPVIPRGFPKNPQKLLQTLTVPEAPPPSRPAEPVSPRPSQPPRKKIATPQQQLEMRMKAIEEQKRQLAAAAAASASGSQSITAPVIAAAVDKGEKRVAHQPVAGGTPAAQIPRVMAVSGSKLSLPFRQQVLEKFIQHMSQIYPSQKEAVDRAVQTEKDIAVNSFHMGTYRNKATQELVKLKQAVAPVVPAAVGATTGQKDKPMTFPKASPTTPQQQKQNFSVMPKNTQQRIINNDPRMWSDMEFYAAMKKSVLTEDHLVINGYPLIQAKKQDGENRRDGLQLYIAMSGKITPDRITQTRRICCRCKKDFTVDFEGNYARDEECVYHWGKAFSRRVSGEGIAAKRTCCSDESSSYGCCVAKCHVADTIPSLSGFVSSTGVPATRPEDKCKVFAIDCEMIYTVGGIELARVTMVDRHLKTVYETLVKPKQRIIDCNTRFSGLKPEMFNRELGKGMKSIEEVHKDLLGGLITEDTILIGHSLESDLLAMKLIHRNIVDTSIVFPHKRGPPFKRALRNLMRELLNKIIQEDVGGHDSREDAAACMELMMWKTKQDRERRT
ncbi:putative exonuclease GOR [Paramacrobiotus metropolitanus]|uniref:putative exonuclease GOR n=1 Tax=Paramacrobiotus metropolitanus TaxID=2943436 RepID=UPI0024461E12|nr:putative exonuclease GOR [Paramacrobiotus metropolitanus]